MSIAELRESVAAAGLPDEGMRGSYADQVKLHVAADPDVLRALAEALRGRSIEAQAAAAVVRSVAITPSAAAAVCGEGVALSLCGVLRSGKGQAAKGWALAALARLAQHPEAHPRLLRAGAAEVLALHTARPPSAPAPGPAPLQLDVLAALGLALLGPSAGQATTALVPLRAVPGFVDLLQRRLLAASPEAVVAARTFCGLPVDYRPRFVAQALTQLCEASASHVAMAWRTNLPELIGGVLHGVYPNDTEANQPFGSPDVVEMAARCRAALLARGAGRQNGDAERAADLRDAPGAAPGTWEKQRKLSAGIAGAEAAAAQKAEAARKERRDAAAAFAREAEAEARSRL